MTTADIVIHQRDDGVEDSKGLPSSHDRGRSTSMTSSVELQAKEDVRNLGGLRNRKMNSSRQDEDVSELRNDKEKSSHPDTEQDGVKPDSSQFSTDEVPIDVIRGAVGAKTVRNWVHVIYGVVVAGTIRNWGRLVIFLILILCSRPVSGKLYMDHDESSKDQLISEMRIVETPLQSVRSVTQSDPWGFKWARHDYVLFQTVGSKWYRAEKHGPSSRQVGIHFNLVSEPGAVSNRFRLSFSMNFSLAQARHFLEDHECHYSLWAENCWKYAHSRAEAILRFCIENASDGNLLNELKKKLVDLTDTRRRMPNEVVDIVQDWKILQGILLCLVGVIYHFWLYSCKDLLRRPSFSYYKVGVNSIVVVIVFVVDPNPVLLTYNLTWLATTYSWLFNFLSFFGYCIGWAVAFSDVKSWNLVLSGDPVPRTAISGGGEVDRTNVRANCHQGDSMKDQPKKWCSRTSVFGFLIVYIVMTLEKAFGYSRSIVYLRSFLVCLGILAIKQVLNGRRTRSDEKHLL